MLDGKRFIDELNAHGEWPQAIGDAILRERTASVECRLAALLWHAASSKDDLLANAAFELIIELTFHNGEPIADPLETNKGRKIRELVHASPDELRAISCDESARVFRRGAAVLILEADSDECSFNPYKDRLLRMLTGHDMKWWIDWIRQQRS